MDQASGMFVSSGIAYRPDTDHGLFNIDIGSETYVTSYMTGRVSLMGLVNSDDWFTGADTGVRLQTPTRLAPFVGIGANTGFASETVVADDDWENNDDDGFIDEYGEEDWRISGAYISVYPEVGTHFWWTPDLRLSTYGRYMVSSEGRRADDWLIGASVAIFTNPFFQ